MTGLELKGNVKIIAGRVYIDQNPVDEALAQFNERYTEVRFEFPDKEMKIDDGIKPLVDALQEAGIKTLSSCEGHEGTENWFTYVSFIVDRPSVLWDVIKWNGFWHFEKYSMNVYSMRHVERATREEILELANKIREASKLTAR